MRLFIAINFNDQTKKELVSIQNELRNNTFNGRFTTSENLHLTLAFLGECDVKQTELLKSIIDNIKFEPLLICLNRVGRFKRDDGDLWWVGVEDNARLTKLYIDLTDKLKSSGFMVEKRKYKPHVTIGRKIVTDKEPWLITSFNEVITGIDLMKSEHVNGVLKYSVIHSLHINCDIGVYL